MMNTVASTAASTLTLSGTGEVDATLTVFDGTVTLGTATVQKNGSWSLVLSGLITGTHTFSAQQPTWRATSATRSRP